MDRIGTGMFEMPRIFQEEHYQEFHDFKHVLPHFIPRKYQVGLNWKHVKPIDYAWMDITMEENKLRSENQIVHY